MREHTPFSIIWDCVCYRSKRYTIKKFKARSCYMSYYQLKRKRDKKKKNNIFSEKREKSKDDEKEGCTVVALLAKK